MADDQAPCPRRHLLTGGPLIRLGAFAGILAVMALWEWRSPRRHQEIGSK
jgi:hypothetical protein